MGEKDICEMRKDIVENEDKQKSKTISHLPHPSIARMTPSDSQ